MNSLNTDLKVLVYERGNSEDNKIIFEKIKQFNENIVGPSHSHPLTIVIKKKDEIIAGLYGKSSRGWLFIEYLWVDKKQRLSGLGKTLLKKAEHIAKSRDCNGAYLDTFSFQAKDFYIKQGYKKFGELKNYPVGHNRYFMMKTL